jgi:DnaA-homolog protein
MTDERGMQQQLVLPLSHAYDWPFFSTQGSAALRAVVDSLAPVVAVWGGEGCGKSHALRAFGDGFAMVADDVDTLDAAGQEGLFHAVQGALVAGQRVLVSSTLPVAQTGLREDVRSRLLLGTQVELLPPSDAEWPEVLQAWAKARQVRLPPAVSQFLLRHAERGPRALAVVLARLDGASLVQQRPLTVPLVKQVLGV